MKSLHLRRISPFVIPALVVALAFTGLHAAGKTDDTAQLLVGKWKVIGTECDKDGKNCTEIKDVMIIEFTADGKFKAMGIDDKSTYVVEGKKFIITNSSGGDKSTVNIVQLDKTTLRTQEEGKEKTEKFVREK